MDVNRSILQYRVTIPNLMCEIFVSFVNSRKQGLTSVKAVLTRC